MVTEPEATPVTTPEVEPTVAMATLLLLHAPPGTTLLNVVVAPAHVDDAPVMPAGDVVTDSENVAAHPVPNV